MTLCIDLLVSSGIVIGMPAIHTIPVYSASVVKLYYKECLACLQGELPIATVLVSSACLEVALLDALSFEPWKTISKRFPERMDLIDLLDWARQVVAYRKMLGTKAIEYGSTGILSPIQMLT